MIGFDHVLDSSSEEEGEDDDNQSKNSSFFLSHLRKCFIAIDDNNFCEKSILPDLKIFLENNKLDGKDSEKYNYSLLTKRLNENSYEYTQISRNDEARHSIAARGSKQLMRFNSIAPEINENVKQKKELKIFGENPLNQYELEIETEKLPIISPLTKLLEQSIENPFMNYAKFEALSQDQNEIKTFQIFLPTENENIENSMQVSIYKSALFSDLIGLVCCKYINENRQPQLKFDSVEYYELKIEDEEDLTIESNQRVAKYGFKDLVLVESLDCEQFYQDKNKFDRQISANKKVTVKIYFTDDSPCVALEFDSDNISMEEVYKQVHRYKMENIELLCPRIDYKLEHVDRVGVEIDLEKSYLSDFKKKFEFIFYRSNSIRKQSSPRNSLCSLSFEKNTLTDVTRTVSENKKYDVVYLSQWKKDQFIIEPSKDELVLEEIKSNRRSNFYTIPLKYVVECTFIKDSKNIDNSIRIIITEEESLNVITYKYLDFEGSLKTIEELKTSINHLIEYCNSPYSKQYKNLQKKTTEKWSRRAYRDKHSKRN